MSEDSLQKTPVHPIRLLARQLQVLHNGIAMFPKQMQDVLNWQRLNGRDFLRRMEDELPEPLQQEWNKHRGKLKKQYQSLIDQSNEALSTAEGISQHLSWAMKEDASRYETDLRRSLRKVVESLCNMAAYIPWKDFDLTLYDYNRLIGVYQNPLREASVTLETVALRPTESTSPPPNTKGQPGVSALPVSNPVDQVAQPESRCVPMSNRAMTAYSQYNRALSECPGQDGRVPTDRQCYDWLKGHNDEEKLLEFDTWQRYVRQARKCLNERKNTPRAGREHGRSIVLAQDIEPLETDKPD
jgi:hypothetical protein